MTKFFYILIFPALFLLSCDKFYGPVLQNNLDEPLDIKVYFLNGDVVNALRREPCMTTFLGRGKGQDQTIQKIIISRDGQILHMLGAEQVEKMLKIQDEYYGYSVWSISSEGGITFLTGSEAKECDG